MKDILYDSKTGYKFKKLCHIRDNLIKEITYLEEMYRGEELTNYNYWKGFDFGYLIGYLKGKLSVIEDIMDDLL